MEFELIRSARRTIGAEIRQNKLIIRAPRYATDEAIKLFISKHRRWIENKKEKHNHNASKGWYRYDTLFALPKQNSLSGSDTELRSIYRATLVVRISEKGLFLYDVINIKKEASTPPGL